MTTALELKKIYKILQDSLGRQHWWPGESAFEVMVGAILTQNTNWSNVESSIANLKAANVLAPKKLFSLSPAALAELIRPSGYYNIKAKRLRSFLKYLIERYDGSIEKMEKVDVATLREEILSVSGIGKETADSILLYALGKPVFVIDTYTKRILVRHNIVDEDADYDAMQELFTSALADDVKLFNEYHALIVNVGKHWCRTKPKCEECPLGRLDDRKNISL